MSEPVKKSSNRNALIAVGAVVVCCMCLIVGSAANRIMSGGTTTTLTTFDLSATVLKVSAEAAANGANATDAPTPIPAQAGIPGLIPEDVTVNLEKIEFKCDAPDRMPSGLYLRTCLREDSGIVSYMVEVWGSDRRTVDTIVATVVQFVSPTDDIPVLMLGFIATMPYDSADPDQARAWVEATLPTLPDDFSTAHASIAIAGVEFRLSGDKAHRTLEMGNP